MKKTVIILLLIALLIPLAACAPSEDALSIVATNFAAYDFAREIVGRDNTDIAIHFIAGGDVHSFDPTFQDMAKIERCSLFLQVGGASDAAIDTLLQSVSGINVFRLVDQVELLADAEHSDDTEHSDDGEHMNDEHVWTSPENAVLIVTALTEEIARIDPDNAATYRQNAAAYIEKLLDLDARFETLIENQQKPVVFGDRFPFLYFANAYALRYESAFVSCHVTSEPSPARISELITLCREEGVHYIFHIEGGSHSVADRIAADIDGETLLFHACHKVTSDEIANGASYLSLMEENYSALQKALS